MILIMHQPSEASTAKIGQVVLSKPTALITHIKTILQAGKFQKLVCQIASSPSPHRWCTSSILSTDLQMPLQLQSNDAAQGFPAWAFHSQSITALQLH
jgi:hypothetical protein